MIISRLFLVRMRNVTDNRCIENQNTHFVLNNLPVPLPPPGNAVYEIMSKKYGRAREATDNMLRLCTLHAG